MGNKVMVLDCTLRDGGYVNNWEFDTKTALAIRDGLYDSGVRYIELGILGQNVQPGKQTKFSDFAQIELLLEGRKPDCNYAVMFTQENAGSFAFPERSEKTPNSIRLAFFKNTWPEALETAREMQDKGYAVFLQAMATFMYAPKELSHMLEGINQFSPAAFYMVDSFSTMYPKDVRTMRDSILRQLSPDIMFGFHAHNSLQMAFANVQEFLECPQGRVLFVDGSIYGMGRGAGNVPLELLMQYLNDTKEAAYDIGVVLSLFQRYLKPIYEKYGWGYTLEYFLAAAHKTNSAYGWYFTSHGVSDLGQLDRALGEIPSEIRYSLRPDAAQSIVDKILG